MALKTGFPALDRMSAITRFLHVHLADFAVSLVWMPKHNRAFCHRVYGFNEDGYVIVPVTITTGMGRVLTEFRFLFDPVDHLLLDYDYEQEGVMPTLLSAGLDDSAKRAIQAKRDEMLVSFGLPVFSANNAVLAG